MSAARSIWLAIAGSLVIAVNAAPAQPPAERIVFESLRTGDAEVWSAAADGTRQRNLSRSPDTEDATPALSPDGTLIAFVRSTGSRNVLWLMDSQGGVQRRLGEGSGSDFNPAWSPDGSRIAFSTREGGDWDLVISDLSGSRTRITTGPGDDIDASWSPDASRLVFDRLQAGTSDLWTVSAQGGAPEPLTATPRVAELTPAWSPDGREIAYDATVSGEYDLFALDVASRKVRRLTRDAADDGDPAWSPDGSEIAFRRSAGDDDYEIAVVATAPGGNRRPRNLSRNRRGIDLAPSWSVSAAPATPAARQAINWVFTCHAAWPGTASANDYVGTSKANKMCGGAGDDVLRGRGGADWLSGGSGRDRLYGEKGKDKLKARDSTKDRRVSGGSGSDTALLDAVDNDNVSSVEAKHF